MKDRILKIKANAKINLTLEVLGMRPDGFHELRSVLMPVSLFDTVTLEEIPGPGIEVEMRAEGVDVSGMSGENLAARAAKLFQARTGISRGVRIRIVKRIPLGGGLGGGSADAAAVLRGLQTVWDARLKRAELLSMAAELGSDVPAMTLGGAVLMEGRGEKVRRIRVPGDRRMWILLANDGTHCPTAEIYGHYDRMEGRFEKKGTASLDIVSPVFNGDTRAVAGLLSNDLQEVVLNGFIDIRLLYRKMLSEEGALGVLVSGSGSSVFALMGSETQGKKLRAKIKEYACWSALVQTLPGDPPPAV